MRYEIFLKFRTHFQILINTLIIINQIQSSWLFFVFKNILFKTIHIENQKGIEEASMPLFIPQKTIKSF